MWSSYTIVYGVSEPPLAVELDLCLDLGLDGPVGTDGKRHDLSPARLQWVMSDNSRSVEMQASALAAAMRLDGDGQLSGAQLSSKR